MTSCRWVTLSIVLLWSIQNSGVTPLHAEWTKTGGPYGGNVRAIVASGLNIVVGTDNGIFLSTDNGVSWTTSVTNTTVMALTALEGFVLASTLELPGLRVSSDHGVIWRSTAPNVDGLIRAFAIGNNRVFAGTTSGVFVSQDYGDTWSRIFTWRYLEGVTSLAFSGNYLFAATDLRHLYRTGDNGTTWTDVYPELRGRINCLAVDNLTVLAGTTEGEVFRSTDSGESWVTSIVDSVLDFRNITSLAICNAITFAAIEWGATYVSNDLGQSWHLSDDSLLGNVNAITTVGQYIFVGTGSGVLRSNDGARTWELATRGLSNARVSSLHVTSSAILAGVLGGGVFISTNEGNSWFERNYGLTNLRVCAVVSNGLDVLAGTAGGAFRSTNYGANWEAISELSGNTNAWQFVVLPTTDGTYFFAATENGVFVSTDQGISWSLRGVKKKVSALSTKGTQIYAAGDGVSLSTDFGKNWSAISTEGLPRPVNSIAATDSYLFAGTYQGVFRYDYLKLTWTNSSVGLSDSVVEVLHSIGSDLLAGTSNGPVFISTNNGMSWFKLDSGVPYKVTSLAVNETYLFAGTVDQGVYRYVWSDFQHPREESTSAKWVRNIVRLILLLLLIPIGALFFIAVRKALRVRL